MHNRISFMTANYVARETGYAMHGWGHGDSATNAAFAPIDTYAAKLDELLADVRRLGFDTVDVWGAHLSPDWATDEHLAAAREALDRHGLGVATYATWLSPENADRACALALGLGTDLIGAGFSGDRGRLLGVLRERGVRLGIENHPDETSPSDVLARIGDDTDVLGATVDTGWWGTHGYDAPRAIDELAGHVLHVHLKDVLRVGEPHDTCRWGEGVVDVEGCVRALKRIGYTGAITVEHEPETSDPTAAVGEMRGELERWLA
jgi:sugar phosphate isomerase/epimerase